MHLLTHTLSFQSKKAPPCHRGDMGCSAAILHPLSVVQSNHLSSHHCSRLIFNQTAAPPVSPCRLRAGQRVLFSLNGLWFLCFCSLAGFSVRSGCGLWMRVCSGPFFTHVTDKPTLFTVPLWSGWLISYPVAIHVPPPSSTLPLKRFTYYIWTLMN